MILTTALTSCTTSRKSDSMIWYPVPDPIVDGEPVVKKNLTTGEVTMPNWYWDKIEVYIIMTEANIMKLH